MKDFEKNFLGYKMPIELIELFNFQESSAKEFSQGFKLLDLSEKYMLKTYSEDTSFLNSIIEFAKANYSDSHYAFWINQNKNLESAPIVIFGDEGGYHIVSENIKQFLEILSYDTEPMVTWDSVTFHKDDHYEISPENVKYKNWLAEKFNIQRIEPIESIINHARSIYSENFNNWMKQYRNN